MYQAALLLGMACGVAAQTTTAGGPGGPGTTQMMQTTTTPAPHACYDWALQALNYGGVMATQSTFATYSMTSMSLALPNMGAFSSMATYTKYSDGTKFTRPVEDYLGALTTWIDTPQVCQGREPDADPICLTVMAKTQNYPAGFIFPSCYGENMTTTSTLDGSPSGPGYSYNWIDELDIECKDEDLDGRIKWTKGREIAYACCQGSGCNRVTNETLIDVTPNCMDPHAVQCVEKYTGMYGCSGTLNASGGFLLPPPEGSDMESCFYALAPGTGCLKQHCSMCNCNMTEEMIMMQPMGCATACGLGDDWPSPGCHKDMIGDGHCDLFCMTKDSKYDGADCFLSPEYPQFGPFTERGTDDFSERLEDSLKGNDDFQPAGIPMDKPAEDLIQKQTLVLFSLLDKNFDNELTIEEDHLGDILTDYDVMKIDMAEHPDGINAVELFNFFMKTVSTLDGTPVREGVDMLSNIRLAVRLAGASDDEHPNLKEHEAQVLGIDEHAFKEIDENDDDRINATEIWNLARDVAAKGCSGFRQVMKKDGEFGFFASPLRPKMAECNVLVMPNMFYKPEGFDMPPEEEAMWGPELIPTTAPGTTAGGGGPPPSARRRLLSMSGSGSGSGSGDMGGSGSGGMGGSGMTTTFPDPAPRDLNKYNQWMATIMSIPEREVLCQGALITKKGVITTAGCVKGKMPEQIVVRVGGTMENSGLELMVDKVSVHPGHKEQEYKLGMMETNLAMYNVAILVLSEEAEGLAPIKLYDGLDTGATDCKELELQVRSWSSTTGLGYNVTDLDWEEDNHECDEKFMTAAGFGGVIKQDMVCVYSEDPMQGFREGAPLVVSPKKRNGQRGERMWQLVGLSMNSHMMPPPNMNPGDMMMDMDKADLMMDDKEYNVFTRTSNYLQWIYAHSFTEGGPRKFDSTLKLEFEELDLTKDGDKEAELMISMGPSVSPMATELKKCDVPGPPGEFENPTGAFTLQFKMPSGKTSFDFEAEIELDGCGMNEEMMPGDDMMPGYEPRCKRCTLFDDKWKADEKWASVLDMVKMGLAYTGGLGKKGEMLSTFDKTYGVWACAKDWGVEEQLKCSVGQGELYCFIYEENMMQFDDYGTNMEKKLVKMDKEMRNDMEYLDGLSLF